MRRVEGKGGMSGGRRERGNIGRCMGGTEDMKRVLVGCYEGEEFGVGGG